VVLLIMQTPVVCEANATGSPELALTVTVNGAAPTVWLGTAGKLMVCATCAGPIENICMTGGAGAYVTPSPGWFAVTEQMPTASSVMVVPLTVHAAGDCDVSVTGNPELALTGGANGGEPTVWLGIAGKLIVWLASAGEIRNVCVTGAAGAYVTPSPG
jgi:hypothetical protein